MMKNQLITDCITLLFIIGLYYYITVETRECFSIIILVHNGMLGVFRERDRVGDKLVIVLQGLPCPWGKCIFCPFALEQGKSLGQVISTNRRILEEAGKQLEKDPGLDRIVVFNGGSFHELPFDTLEKLAPLARGKRLELEERSEYVTLNAVDSLTRLYVPRKLVIRVGFEVIDEKIRNDYLRKGMDNGELHRLSKLRLEAREKGYPLEIWSYVLYGMEGISEELVKESVAVFNRLLDGVVAIRYHRYLPHHPPETPVSRELVNYLLKHTKYVDTGEDEIWVIKKKD